MMKYSLCSIKMIHGLTFLGIGFISLIISCTTPYHIQNFDEITNSHKVVAVLPFDMIYTGMIPEELTEEDLNEIEAAESQAFQISFYNEVLGSTKNGRRNLSVNLQPINKTNRILKENELSGIEVHSLPYEDIAEMLDVDAFVTGQIQKNRLMSDLASYGIEIGVHILDVMSPHTIWPFIPGDLSRSKEIKSSYAIYDGNESLTLWSVSYNYDADWRRSANDIIDETNRRAARKFPYRVN